ncbi:MAG: hypothetical protein LBI94_01785, partial [Treponema sp.]|nr:hypothetical protein [Treponema sp.]
PGVVCLSCKDNTKCQSCAFGQQSATTPAVRETKALGAAYLAVGFWENPDEVKRMWRCGASFGSFMSAEKRDRLLSGWRRAVGRSRGWAE